MKHNEHFTQTTIYLYYSLEFSFHPFVKHSFFMVLIYLIILGVKQEHVMTLLIRHASPVEDSEPISELINICIEEKRTVLNPYTPREERQCLENLQPREAVYVAYNGDVFSGFAGVAPRYAYSNKLSHCGECGTWVMPEYRGMGVGRALWERGILPWCSENGYTYLGAMVMTHNTGSIDFYKKMGSNLVGTHHKTVKWKDQYLDTIEIEQILE